MAIDGSFTTVTKDATMIGTGMTALEIKTEFSVYLHSLAPTVSIGQAQSFFTNEVYCCGSSYF